MIFLGLDLGTTTVSGVRWQAESGRVVGTARRRNDAALPQGRPTRAEQDSYRLRTLALEVLAELASAGEPLDGLGLTGQKHGLLCVDGGGQPLTPLISWQDARTAEPVPGQAGTTLDLLGERVAGLDWRPNGCRVQHGYGAATLFWLAEQQAVPPGTERACTAAGWLAGQLTGLLPSTDPTYAASWGIFDVQRGTWNRPFVAALGLPPWLLPPVLPSAQRLGGLLPGVARETGLPAGLPVYNAVGDTQASFLASVPEPLTPQTVVLNLGTGGQVCWAVARFELPGDIVETRPLPHGRFLRVGASLCGGAAYAWLNDTVRGWLAEFGLLLDEQAVYDRLNSLAAAVDDPGALRVQTTFLGVRGPAGPQAGAIEGISLDNMALGALARATLTGLVDELRAQYLAHATEDAGRDRIVAAGGAVERNPLLLEIIGQRFGLPVELSRQPEAAAAGAALLSAGGNSGER